MPPNDESNTSISADELAALKSLTNVGTPGPSPTTPYQPTAAQLQDISLAMPILVDWQLSAEDYRKISLGHHALEMEDKWNIYTTDNIVHFHRSWTGDEIFRFTLHASGDVYRVVEIVVEQNPEHYKTTDINIIIAELLEVMRVVLGVVPVNINQFKETF